MHVISWDNLIAEDSMRPHEEVLADGKLEVWEPSMMGRTVVSCMSPPCSSLHLRLTSALLCVVHHSFSRTSGWAFAIPTPPASS